MKVIVSEKFKFFPVNFGTVMIPLGDIAHIYASTQNSSDCVCICTRQNLTTYRIYDMSLEQAHEIYMKAFKDCELE